MNTERLILGLDCSGHTYSVALYAGRLLGERTGGQPRQHLRDMFPALDELCRECGQTLKQVQAVAVTAGPGTFTGLRTALLLAKTLGQSLGIPIYPLDTLEVLAAAVDEGEVVAALDARKNQVVWAPFRLEGGKPLRLQANRLDAPDVWVAGIAGRALLGSACASYERLLNGQHVLPAAMWNPSAAAAARLVTRQSGPGCHWSEIRPDYVRPADVQVHGGGNPG